MAENLMRMSGGEERKAKDIGKTNYKYKVEVVPGYCGEKEEIDKIK